jgi:prepilin-type N-terminal cleavage/methylation domain-containing protein
MKLRRPRSSSRPGFTLVELLIGATLFSGLLLVAGMATDRTVSKFRQSRAAQEVSARAVRMLQHVSSEFAFARRGNLDPVPDTDFGSSTLTYQRCEGAVVDTPVWSSPRTLRWELEAGELLDDVDNNQNGLIDEGMLVWIENLGLVNEQRVVWGHGLARFQPGEEFNGDDDNENGLLDEQGLSFSLAGDVLTIRVAVQGLGPDKNVITRTAQTSVLIRN